MRRDDLGKKLGEWPFEIGLWVGRAATPNRMGRKGDNDRRSARAKTMYFQGDTKNRPAPIPLENCPWCGTKFTGLSFQLLPTADEPRELRIGCANPSCPFRSGKGDRLDLEILASLIQPLSSGRPATADDDEDFDESDLGEEAERRQIDAQKGKATGGERDELSRATTEKLEKAAARLGRRLRRAADSIERSLEFLDKIATIPTQAVARQIWMSQIGAFLSGRMVTSDDGDEVECLDPTTFAEYVIRVARALVGSHRGGFLDHVPKGLWDTPDGEMLKRGLGFLRTCVLWATAYLIQEYSTADPEEGWPDHLACAIPELVAARFVEKMSTQGIVGEEEDLARRFPSWAAIVETTLNRHCWMSSQTGCHPNVSRD